MGLLLYIIAKIGIGLTFILTPFTFVWKWITYGWKDATDYLGTIAHADDQKGNVYLKEVLNRWTVKKGGKIYYYGDEDDTISYVCAMNFYKNASNRFGNNIGFMLDKVDKDHLKKAIKNKYKRDLEALERLKQAGAITYEIKPHFEAIVSYPLNVTNKKR